MKQHPLLLFAQNCTLPEDEEQRQECIKALQTALSQVFAEYDINPNGFKFFDGHIFSQVDSHCPDCNDPLQLSNFDPGPGNGADASATCACGFEGRAVYRLIDVEQNLDYDTVDALFEEGSSVGEGDYSVDYSPYQGTELHFPE